MVISFTRAGGQWTHQTGQDKKLTDQQKARHRGEMGQREDRWMEEWREEIKARSCQQTGDLCEVLAACYLTLQKIEVLGLIGPKIIKKIK